MSGKTRELWLVCRQCGSVFPTEDSKVYAICPDCRSAQDALASDDGSLYSWDGLDSARLLMEVKLRRQQRVLENLEETRQRLAELVLRLVDAVDEAEKARQAQKDLQERVRALEMENLKLLGELSSYQSRAVSWH